MNKKSIKQNVNTAIFCFVTEDYCGHELYKRLEDYKSINNLEVIFILDSIDQQKVLIDAIEEILFIDVKLLFSEKRKQVFPEIFTTLNIFTKKEFAFFCKSLPTIECLIDSIALRNEFEKSIIKIESSEDSEFNGFSRGSDLDYLLDNTMSILIKVFDCSIVNSYVLETEHYNLNLLSLERQLHLVNYRTYKILNKPDIGRKRTLKIQVDMQEVVKSIYPNTKNRKLRPNKNTIRQLYSTRSAEVRYNRCRKYLKTFKQFDLDVKNLMRSYEVLALVPAFNESKHLIEFLDSVTAHCDGVILLDDESSDDTFELSRHPIVKLRVAKYRNEFNDLANRNILLRLASFFNCKWLYFLDVDEKIVEQFGTIESITDDKNVDTVAFQIINLWNDQEHYRIDMNDTNRTSTPGVFYRWRMFRNLGQLQLLEERKLHFCTTPFVSNGLVSSVLLKHSGYLNKMRRINKYKFYKEEDVNKYLDYEFILKSDIILGNTANLTMENIENNAKDFLMNGTF